jgi:hypothetical protein
MPSLYLYHGTGNLVSIHEDGYDPEMTSQGGHDQLGSGFYHTSCIAEAAGYTEKTRCDMPPDTQKMGGDQHPGVAFVKITLTNPLFLKLSDHHMGDHDHQISKKQAYQMIKDCPRLMNIDDSPLRDMVDDFSVGFSEKDIQQVAGYYAGQALDSIEADFYGEKGEGAAFRKSATTHTGFDGVIHEKDDGIHVVAWFPAQIEFTPVHHQMYAVQSQLNRYQDSGITQEQLKRKLLSVISDPALKSVLAKTDDLSLESLTALAADYQQETLKPVNDSACLSISENRSIVPSAILRQRR